MGMFDYVNFRMECPGCGALVDGFQTKDRERVLETVEPDEVSTFYSSCSACSRWVELTRKPVKRERLSREVPLTLAEVQALGFRLVERNDQCRAR